MNSILLVAAGGAIGATLRHLAGLATIRLFGSGFPWGTLLVNILGSFAMGLFISWLVKRTGGTSQEIRLFFATGILGGFTTFSAFSLDLADMIERGANVPALGYMASSVLLSLLAVFIGLWFGRSFL